MTASSQIRCQLAFCCTFVLVALLARGQVPSYMNKHRSSSTVHEADAVQSRKKRQNVSDRPTPDPALTKTRGLTSAPQESDQTTQLVRSKRSPECLSAPSPHVLSTSAAVCNSSLWDFLHLSLEAAAIGHCQTGPLLQDLSCCPTDRAHTDEGFDSRSAGLDSKLCQLYSWTAM